MAPRISPTLGGFLAVLCLGGCAGKTPYEKLLAAQPSGTPFARALFADYAALARSLKIESLPGTTAFDADSAIALNSIPAAEANLAIAYAAKAERAAEGEEVLPEPAPSDDSTAEAMRLDLLRVLVNGRKKEPVEAARAQAQYDCWVLNGAVPDLAEAATACARAFQADLAHLRTIPGIMEEPAPPAAAAPADSDTTGPAPLKSSETPQDSPQE